MNRLFRAGWAVCLVLTGCATGPNIDTPSQPAQSTTSNTDADARGRARIHTELAAGYLELKNFAIALEEAGIAQRSDPTYGPAYNVAGLIYAELKNDALAEQNFQQALRINRRDSDANNDYGAFLCQRKREVEAIRHFMAAASEPFNQQPDRSYVYAGMCARNRGDIAEAESHFRNALKVQPNQIQAIYQLADLSYARANYPDARLHLQRLIPVAANSPEILWLMLRTERRLGDRNSVDSLSHQLRARFPESKEARALASGQFD
jgi:type IV pilus assembly protein PilF